MGATLTQRTGAPREKRTRRPTGIGLNKNKTMLSYAITFLIIALIAGVLGFFAVAGLAATIAKILFVVFLIAFVISLLTGRRAI